MYHNILFPTICIDDFYKDPDFVRDFALSLEYENDPTKSGRYPGKRTKPLNEIDMQFFNNFCEKFMSIHFNFLQSRVEWQISTAFQKIEPYHTEKNNFRNIGWIHQDDSVLVSGVIFLNKDVDSNTGTSIFKLKKRKTAKNKQETKNTFYSKGIDNNYDEEFIDHINEFEETINFKNVYNRLISFDSLQYHRANSFHTGGEPRLTQVFFVHEIKTEQKMPIERLHNISLL